MKMNEGETQYASSSIPLKRKRGRPRKYPSLHNVQNAQPQKDTDLSRWKKVNLQENQTVNHGENASVPPGFESPNSSQPSQGNHGQSVNDIVVGQVVYGVVEAVFDAGCLLSVRVGNSRTTLRGVVFRPGHYVPVTAENDVAPNVEMVRRKEITMPTVNAAQVQVHNSQAKEISSSLASLLYVGTANPPSKLSSAGVPKTTISVANTSISRSKQLPSVSPAANLSSAGGNNTMPIAIQCANFSDGVLVHNQPSPVSQTVPPTTLGNQYVPSSHPSNSSVTTNQPIASDEVIGSNTQFSHQTTLEGKPNENDMEVNCTISPGMSFQNLLTEVMKRAEHPSQRVDTSVQVVKSQAQESGGTHEIEANASPQAVESTPHKYSAAVPTSTSSLDNRTDKMGELIRENFDDNRKLKPRRPKIG